MQHPGIDTFDASLQLEFGFIKVTSIRILERTALLCVVSVLMEGDVMITHDVPKRRCVHIILYWSKHGILRNPASQWTTS